MKNKNYYKKASFFSAIICFVLCALLGFMFITDIKSEVAKTPWILMIISLVVCAIGVYQLVITMRFRARCFYIKKNGLKYNGKVLDIHKTEKMSGEGASSYRFLVEYYDAMNKEVRFWTPYTSFAPHSNNITCTVYELNGEHYVDSFR